MIGTEIVRVCQWFFLRLMLVATALYVSSDQPMPVGVRRLAVRVATALQPPRSRSIWAMVCRDHTWYSRLFTSLAESRMRPSEIDPVVFIAGRYHLSRDTPIFEFEQ